MSKRRKESIAIDPLKISYNFNEEFRHINGYEGIYLISNWGRVLSLNSQDNIPRWIIPHMDKYGYCRYILSKNGISKGHTCHRLVATHFISNILFYPQVNHIDGNKLNNSVLNLEWCTAKENIIHSFSLGLRDSKNPQAKLTDKQVLTIRELFKTKETKTSIAKQFNVSINTISRIASGKFYKHVSLPELL